MYEKIYWIAKIVLKITENEIRPIKEDIKKI